MISRAKGLLQARDLIDKGLAKLGSGEWKHEQVPTGVKALDDLFGGWPKGRFTEIFGQYGTGKSTIAYHTLAACRDSLPLVEIVDEKKKPRPVRAVLIDTEGSYDPERLRKFGFPPEELVVVAPDYGEQGLEAVEAFAAAGIEMIIIDSLRGLVPAKTIERDKNQTWADQQPGAQAKMFSDFFSRYALWHHRPTLIGVNQMYMKIGAPLFADPYETPGGMNMKFIAAFRLQVRRRMKLKKGDKVLGHELACRVDKSKVGPSYVETVVPLVYSKGFVTWELWERLKNKKGVKTEE